MRLATPGFCIDGGGWTPLSTAWRHVMRLDLLVWALGTVASSLLVYARLTSYLHSVREVLA